ncbi:YafY family protein [Anaeromyxobacter sp. SG66]|uniref:helix-turn-helix transcriptional regulator n=1 Tax=Anaeromyxobacter sp. SG66 TaxID=2925410 RepID=UPI001F584FFD|nr:WYL domain-containing protein [Anaeromyxobacter sp. SG66]
MPKPDARAAERRLLKLAAWFLHHGPATRDQVYAAFSRDYIGSDASKEKKWTRDKRDLARLGVPLRFSEDDDGTYRVEPNAFYLPRLSFTPAEAAVLATAAGASLRDGDHPLHDELESALRKLVVGGGWKPPRASDLARGRDGAAPAKLRSWLTAVQDAIEDQRALHLSYWVPARDELTERDVSPYGYAWRRGEWMLVAYCHARKAVRVFYLRRVRGMKSAPRAGYVRPPDDFDVRRWSRQEPWDYLAHEPLEAAVRFTGSLAKIAPRLVPSARLSTQADNARVARFVVRDVDGLVRQCLAWGAEAEVLEPARARDRAREMLGAIGGAP